MKFTTTKEYVDRQSKAVYAYDKYQSILSGKILDVGSDNCYLRDLIDKDGEYIGIGIGGNPDIEVDLEKQTIPFDDSSFDCVLCLDVLEHVDNIHVTFDELCRVSRRYVIISLPNSYRDFVGMLFGSKKDKVLNFKYYGLPVERPDDRHKWFFSNSDASEFVRRRAAMNRMKILQVDNEGAGKAKSFNSFIKRLVLGFMAHWMCVSASDLYYKTHWVVLEKE